MPPKTQALAISRPAGALATDERKPHKKIIRREASEQVMLCWVLDRMGILYAHPANEGKRSKIGGGLLKKMGLRKGLPDLLLFDVPRGSRARGVAIELKADLTGGATPEQQQWASDLQARDWLYILARGWRDAVEKLAGLGFTTPGNLAPGAGQGGLIVAVSKPRGK